MLNPGTISRRDEDMAYETKVILKMMASQIAKAKSLKEAYLFVADAANTEGLEIPSYEEAKKKYEELEKEK